MRRKRCQCCHELYDAEPRSYRRQKTCKKARCRRMRRQDAIKRWKRTYPHYARSDPVKQQKWRAQNPGYWKQWRAKHPGYVIRNRRAQRARNAQRRRVIAKGNDLNVVCIEKLRQINALRLIAKGNDWQRVIDWRIDGICRYLQGQLLIAKRNDIDMRGIFVRK